MGTDGLIDLPAAQADERELLIAWLQFLRGAVICNLDGVDDEQGRWTPDGRLIPLVGVVNHLTHVEWRWIDGAMCGGATERSEAEFRPHDLSVADALARYRERADATDTVVRSFGSLAEPCRWGEVEGADLRWGLLHLINETARHAGHADATRELLVGTTGE